MKKVITRIEIQKRNKDRVNIFIEGEFAFSCSAELVFTHKLKENKAVDIEKLKEIVEEDNYLKCKNNALKIIERSYKTEKEIFDKLKQKGYDEKVIARAIDFLISYNFLNDENYTAMYIKDKIKAEGRKKIKFSLLRKGIDEHIIEEKLKEIDSSQELDTAFELAQRKYKTIIKAEKDNRKIYKKLGDYLLRRGYSFEEVKKVLSQVLKNEDFD